MSGCRLHMYPSKKWDSKYKENKEKVFFLFFSSFNIWFSMIFFIIQVTSKLKTEPFSLNQPLCRLSQRVAMSICLSVCLSVCLLSVTIQNTPFRVSWRLLVKGHIANIGIRWHYFFFLFCFDNLVFLFLFSGFWYLPTD